MGTWAERAVEAEVQLKSARKRIEDLENRLLGLLQGEIEQDQTPLRQVEALLLDLSRWIDENPSVRGLLPSGFYERMQAQLRVARVVREPTSEPKRGEPAILEPKGPAALGPQGYLSSDVQLALKGR